MTYTPTVQDFLTTGNTTADQIYSNKRQIAVGNNVFPTDGGAGSTYTVQVETTSTISSVTTLTAASNKGQYADATGGTFAVNLPAASNTSKIFVIKKTDSSGNAVTVTRAGSDTIDGSTTVSLSAQYDWVVLQSDGTGVWKIVGRTVPSSGVAPATAQYLTLATDATLTAERVFTPGNNLSATDGGAGAAYTLQAWAHALAITNTTLTTASLTVQLASADTATITYTLPDILTAANNDKVFLVKKIDATAQTIVLDASGSQLIDGATTYTLSNQYDWVMIAADTTNKVQWHIVNRSYPAGSFAPVGAQYLLLANDSTLTADRAFTAANNVFGTDAGANSTYTVQVDPVTSVSGNTTVTNTSNSIYLVDASGGAVAITLPAATFTSKKFIVKKTDSSGNAVTVTRAGSDTIDGATTFALVIQYQAVSIVANGTASWYIL